MEFNIFAYCQIFPFSAKSLLYVVSAKSLLYVVFLKWSIVNIQLILLIQNWLYLIDYTRRPDHACQFEEHRVRLLKGKTYTSSLEITFALLKHRISAISYNKKKSGEKFLGN